MKLLTSIIKSIVRFIASITWREWLAFFIGVAALAGPVIMWNAEGFVKLANPAADPGAILADFQAKILPGIQQYSLAIGGILLAISVSYILLGAQEDISTSLNDQDLKK